MPAGSDGKPDSRSRFSYHAAAGQSAQDHFLVKNTGTTEQSFTVLATDAYNDTRGDYALLATADKPKAIGTWVKFENGDDRIVFSLKPGESRALAFTIAVPANATPGDHVGGLLASVVTSGSEVKVDRRVATRLYVRVNGQLQPMLSISGLDADHRGDWWNLFTGSVQVRYKISNTGNVALAANYTGGVNTWFGLPLGRNATGTVEEVLPGQTVNNSFVVTGVAQLLYLDPYLQLSPIVNSPDPDSAVPTSPVSRDTVVFAPPWSLLILLAIAALVVVFLRWRRRRNAARTEEWIAHMEAEARKNAEAELAGVETGSES